MPLDLNENYRTVSGVTPDDCKYIQNDVRYQADQSVCEGSIDPEANKEPEVVVRSAAELAEEATELAKRAVAAAELAQAAADEEADTGSLEEDPEIKPDPSDDTELPPIVEQLEGDIGTASGDPYKTIPAAKRAIGDDDLYVVRVEAGYLLRKTS